MTSTRKRTAAGLAAAAVACAALAGGTLAQLTDSTAAPAQVLTAGTVNVDVTEGSAWNTSLANLAVGDTAARSLTVTNTGSLPVATAKLTGGYTDSVGQFGGKLSEALTVTIAQGDGTVLATGVPLTALTTGYPLKFANGGLAAGATMPLTFTYKVVGAPATATGSRTAGERSLTTNPDNKYQGSSVSLTYSIAAVQRNGNAVLSITFDVAGEPFTGTNFHTSTVTAHSGTTSWEISCAGNPCSGSSSVTFKSTGAPLTFWYRQWNGYAPVFAIDGTNVTPATVQAGGWFAVTKALSAGTHTLTVQVSGANAHAYIDDISPISR